MGPRKIRSSKIPQGGRSFLQLGSPAHPRPKFLDSLPLETEIEVETKVGAGFVDPFGITVFGPDSEK